MFSDEATEVARAALAAQVTPEEMSRWTRKTWLDDNRGLPVVSIFRSAMVDKSLKGHTWEGHDFTDLMYLCTAVGYCDFVAGDRRSIALVRQTTRRFGYGADLHSDLPSLVESLDRSNRQRASIVRADEEPPGA